MEKKSVMDRQMDGRTSEQTVSKPRSHDHYMAWDHKSVMLYTHTKISDHLHRSKLFLPKLFLPGLQHGNRMTSSGTLTLDVQEFESTVEPQQEGHPMV
jgi:hypothetical protein